MNPQTEIPHDIRHLLLDPANQSLEQLPMLQVIFDRVGTQLSDRLRHLASSLPHFTLAGVESARIGDILDGYEMNAIAGVFQVAAWDSRVLVGFDRDFIFTAIEMLFGGDGSEPPVDDERTFSNIEVQIAQSLCDHVAQALQASFAPITAVRFRFERSETRMDFAGVGQRNNPAIVARFLLQAINRGGEMFVIIPQAALSPLRQSLSKIVTNETVVADPAWVRQIGDEVRRTEVTIRAVLESEDFSLGEIADLKPGQILKLQATPRSRVKVDSSEQPLFWAYLGQNEGFHTLCIDEMIDQQREFINDVLSR